MNLFKFLTPKVQTMYLEKSSTIRQALEKMDYHKYDVIPVLNSAGKYVFSLSSGDILRYIKNEAKFDMANAENKKITSIKRSREYQALGVNCKTNEIVVLSLNQNFIPIYDDREIYIGIIKRKDVIEYLLEKYPDMVE